MTVKEIIEHYNLSPHPEGGYYRRTYTSTITTEFLGSKRPVCTAILFLLAAGQYSRLHRIPQDEIWHFYHGGSLRLVEIRPNGELKEVILGQDITAGQVSQYCVRSGSWFGATPTQGSPYSFVGCTVAPGFCMDELELGEAKDLDQIFPSASQLIAEFCP